MTAAATPLRARLENGGTPAMTGRFQIKSETGRLTDVLLGPAESFRWMGLENAQWSSLVRDTIRKGHKFDKQVAMRQHREMVDAYTQAGVTTHFLPLEMSNPYQVYARDSSFMSPYGAVVCQLANPRRRGEYAAVLRFYLEHGIPIYDMISAGPLQIRDHAFEHVLAHYRAAAFVDIVERDDFGTGAAQDQVLGLLRHFLERHFELELVERGQRLQHLVVELVAPVPALDRARRQREMRKRHHPLGIEKLDDAKPVATRAGAHRVVE